MMCLFLGNKTERELIGKTVKDVTYLHIWTLALAHDGNTPRQAVKRRFASA